MSRGETGRLMAETGVVPKKSKGQNFLIDDRVAERQVDFAGISKSDRVLEVGPGLGILTSRLIERSDDVTCIEIDDILADHVERTYGERLHLIRGDAVKVQFPPFDVFVSNLPYSVSTPIIFKLLEYDFRKAIVMVQKEFADRMVADVGSPDYSRLTVNLFYKADCRILEKVPNSRFKPQPKVDSAIVEIVPRPAPFDVLNGSVFFRVTEATFNHRRKKIGTSLRAAGMIEEQWDIPFLDSRVEDLRPAEISDIANAIFLSRGRHRPEPD
ncbi:MAG: 16S rRNA (adenine(1518)-N(6)/adenine(1519)-N(6))-dimethyltransferase RsmA [Candidatus Methanoplasma sp.]|jgi:16S rRNA (adenine1518-N6/adenine1519-N6)-dimethyltransferase|nr:16S rRNA (adenine(1518)-N(6)/adenine(1519)-N(6))-dimethyltransferase RsmA [Candidatus Methanoplasma sp.]